MSDFDHRLTVLWDGPLSIEDIADLMDRSVGIIKRSAKRLGLPKRGKRMPGPRLHTVVSVRRKWKRAA